MSNSMGVDRIGMAQGADDQISFAEPPVDAKYRDEVLRLSVSVLPLL